MRRLPILIALFAICSTTNCQAQCGFLGRIFRPRATASSCYSSQPTALACYSSQPQYAAACYSQQATAQVCQSVPSPQAVYAAPQAPTKATPQAPPKAAPIPAKSTPQTSMFEPPLPPDAFEPPLPPSAGENVAPPVVAVAAPVVVQVVTDPYGFGARLNAYRAQYGLRPVAYSVNLSASAYQNSLRGFGHWVRMGRRQNAAWGQANAAVVLNDWSRSPGHAAAMLDPTVTTYGIAMASNVWTLDLD